MGSDYPVEGDKLKKLIKKSRQMPIPFGFNPGTSDDDDEYLAAHARKAPEVLGKLALNEGAGTKSSYGTFAVDGSEVHLTCFRTIPQLAKKFKKYLKRFKITLNCVVMDPDGNVIDSDVETLDDWFREEDDRDDAVAAAVEAEAAAEASDAEDDSGIDPADLAARLKALQPKVAVAPPSVVDRVAAGFKGAVTLIREGKLERASVTIAQLEAILARLAAAPRAQAPAAAKAKPAAAPAPAEAPLPRLQAAVGALSERVEKVLGPAGDHLQQDLDRAGELIQTGEAEAALRALRSVQAALRAAEGAQRKWDRVRKPLEPLVTKALAGRSPDAEGLRGRWSATTDLAGKGAWDEALALVPGIVAILRDRASSRS